MTIVASTLKHLTTLKHISSHCPTWVILSYYHTVIMRCGALIGMSHTVASTNTCLSHYAVTPHTERPSVEKLRTPDYPSVAL